MHSEQVAILVKNLKKSFRVYDDKANHLKDKLIFRTRNQYENREVIKDITFSIMRGEAVGLIGNNGCGKSTLLKLINKIMKPDSGTIEVNGKISSLIELGAGFHPDMTGRENIYINGSIFGLSRLEISRRMDEIIRFSELEDYIDKPVRIYSSGMYMRLAFSVAINVDAEVLLIDEILAVGDVNFQDKCFNKLMDIKRKGVTIVIVSHSIDQIESICNRSIWLDDGYIREAGIPYKVHDKYLLHMNKKKTEREKEEADNNIVAKTEKILPDFCGKYARRYGNQSVKLTSVNINSITDQNKIDSIICSAELIIDITTYSNETFVNGNLGFRIVREDGILCYGMDLLTNNLTAKESNSIVFKNTQKFTIELDISDLLNGKYFLDIILSNSNGTLFDEICRVKEFCVKNNNLAIGVCNMKMKVLSGKELNND